MLPLLVLQLVLELVVLDVHSLPLVVVSVGSSQSQWWSWS